MRDPGRVPHARAPRRVPQPQGNRADRRAHARLTRRRLVDGVVAVLLLSFLGVSALVIVTPGQDTALVIRNTLRGGRRSGVLTAAGVSHRQLRLGGRDERRARSGARSPRRSLFQVLRWFGAAYLVLLGLHSLYRAWRSVSSRASAPQGRAVTPVSPGSAQQPRQPEDRGLLLELAAAVRAVVRRAACSSGSSSPR